MNKSKLSFAGHESFICKDLWIKKGVDFISKDKSFNSDDSVVDLGVGKNMVRAIRFWLKALSLTDQKDEITFLARYLFSDNGKDPFIEDFGTIWLMHYLLVKTNHASIYNLIFNDFRKEYQRFDKTRLCRYIKAKCLEKNISFNENTIDKDISVFLRSYLPNQNKNSKKISEEDFSGMFIDLGLIHSFDIGLSQNKNISYQFNQIKHHQIPDQIFLYTIFDNDEFSSSISFRDLLILPNSPGLVFSMNREDLYKKMLLLDQRYDFITFSETAGNQVFQINEKINQFKLLNEYYD